MAKKKTLTSFLTQKNVIKEKKLTYESEELDGIIELKKVNPSKIVNIISDASAGVETEYTTFLRLIYESVPLFKEKELIEKYPVTEPFEIVDKVFDTNLKEIYELGNQILSLYGFAQEVQADIKKP